MTTVSRLRELTIAITVMCITVVVFLHVPPAHAATCSGEDLVGKLERERPGEFRDMVAQAEKTANGEAVLWRIEGQADRPASYLFGTIHLTDDRVAELTASLRTVLDEVGTVALELADVGNKQALQAAILKRPDLVAMPAGKSLWDLIETSDQQTVVDGLNTLGLPRSHAARLQPWLPALMLSLSACEVQRGQAGHPVLDAAIEAYAKKRGATLIGLETAVEQFSAMSSMPLESQVLFLTDAARMRASVDDMNETLIQLYLKRRVTWFMPFAQRAIGDSSKARRQAEAGFMRALIDKRNVNMVERALPHLNAGSVLIAVGAMHLPGETGLVHLLREQGFKITPID